MTFEIIIAISILTVAALAGAFAFFELAKAEKRAELLENTIFAQEETICHQWMQIADLDAENAKLKSKVSLLKLELEDKKK